MHCEVHQRRRKSPEDWTTAAMSSALEWITRVANGYARLRISRGRSRRNVLNMVVRRRWSGVDD
jgi:hypothetical protein